MQFIKRINTGKSIIELYKIENKEKENGENIYRTIYEITAKDTYKNNHWFYTREELELLRKK